MGWSALDSLLLISGAFGLFQKEAAIRCVGVDFIELLDRPAPRHEPREPAHQAAIDPT
jgi:hypothetical protein